MTKQTIVADGEQIVIEPSTIRDIRFEIVVKAAKQHEDEFQIINRINDMPINKNPFHPTFKRIFDNFWPIRGEGNCPKDVSGLTIHHTMSHSPTATAEYCTKVKGYPTIQYHYWVSANDNTEVYQLLKDEWAIWHDHSGTYQTNLSIGMAGHLHTHKPPKAQIEACALLCRVLMDRYNLEIKDVIGHSDRYGTLCPGWNSTNWKDDFYTALNQL